MVTRQLDDASSADLVFKLGLAAFFHGFIFLVDVRFNKFLNDL